MLFLKINERNTKKNFDDVPERLLTLSDFSTVFAVIKKNLNQIFVLISANVEFSQSIKAAKNFYKYCR